MNKAVSGVELVIDDYLAVQPVEVGIAVVSELYDGLSTAERKTFFRQGFEDMVGSGLARQAVEEGKSPEEITQLWAEEIADFLQLRKNYLLYEDEPTRQI